MQQKFEDIYELTPLQEGILFHSLANDSASTYMEQYSFALHGQVDIEKFKKAFDLVFRRHDILRTAFIHDKVEKPLQVIMKQRKPDFSFRDLSYMQGNEAVKEFIEEFKDNDRKKNFDLTRDVLMRIGLIKIDDSNYRFIWTWHHILFDGWCTRLLAEEVLAIYFQLVQNNEPLLPPPTPYKEYVKWIARQSHNTTENYWKQYVSGFDTLSQLIHARPVSKFLKQYDKKNLDYPFDPVVSDGLVLLARKQGVTLNIIIKSLWAILLSKYNDTGDILFGEIVSGRPPQLKNAEAIIGLFINTLPIRFGMSADDSFVGIIKTAHQKAVETNNFHHFPLAIIQQHANTSAELFNHLVSFQNYPEKAGSDENSNEPLAVADLEIFDQTSYDFEVSFFPHRILMAKVGFNTHVFDPSAVDTIMQHFFSLAAQVVQNPQTSVSELSLYQPAERDALISMSKGAERQIDMKTPVDQLIEAASTLWNEKPAVICEGRQFTYKQFNGLVNQLANYLNKRDISHGQIVGLLMERSEHFNLSVTATWKANAAYVPIDPGLPVERITTMINEAAADFLIISKAQADLAESLSWLCPRLKGFISIDQDQPELSQSFDSIYERKSFWEAVGEDASDSITAGGWYSSYTGLPLSAEEMEEYAQNVLLKLKPYLKAETRVLEIGVASGLSMFKIAPVVSAYVGIDQSAVVLASNEKAIAEQELDNITQYQLFAHQLSQMNQASFDVIIINSVVQDFESYRYLRLVVQQAISVLTSRGIIFLGDIMDLEKKHDLVESLEQFRQENQDKEYITKTNWANELFIPKDFYSDLQAEFGEIAAWECSDKIGEIENELTRFRYDCCLLIDKSAKPAANLANDAGSIKHRDHASALKCFDTQTCFHREPRPEDLAYVLFTSGSTGQPKGVMIEHQSMLNHKLAMIDALALDENTVIAQTASQSFDISVWQFVTALVTGGTTVIYPDHIILDIEAFSDSIIQDGITIIEVVPSYLQLLIEHWEEAESQLPVLTHMIVTGEVLPPAMADRWFSLFPDIPLVNAYGPAEAGDDVSLHFMHSAPETSPVPVGRPVNNVTVYVLNSHNQLCPPGVQGEICVSGISVGRGYANQHDSAAFVKDPFDSDQRMYKTGDLGQYNQAGELLFLGRKDNQVKVRGYRIELGEIEAMLSAQQEVAMAAVIVAEQQGGSHRIKAFAAIEEKAHITDQQLLEKLRALLPDYMVPNEVQLLPELPLLNNGKIDRKALEQVNPQATQSKQFVPPETPTEIKIAQVWQQVLGVENIGLYDDFFELGGHSLKAIQLSSRIHKNLGVKLNIRDIFFQPVLQDFSKLVEESAESAFTPIPQLPEKEYYDVSHAQRRLWVLSQFEATSVAYNEGDAYDIFGNFDPNLLEQATLEVIKRHEILRTVFISQEKELFQQILAPEALHFKPSYVDLEAEADPEAEADKIIARATHLPFDLSKGPLFRVTVMRISDLRHVVFTNMHHIINDGWSDAVFMNDLLTFYESLRLGEENRLPALHVQYKDFAAWQNSELQAGKLQEHRAYWLNQLSGELPGLDMPHTFPRPENITYNGKTESYPFSAALTDQVLSLTKKHDVTLFSTLVAMLNVLLYKYTEQTDIILGTYNGSRDHPDLENQVGFYINTLALRNKLDIDQHFAATIKAVHDTNLKALEHRAYPFDSLIDEIDTKRDLARAPLFDILIGLQNYSDVVGRASSLKTFATSFQVKDFQVKKLTSIYDLNFMFSHVGEHLMLNLQFNTDIYHANDIQRLFIHFEQLATWLTARPYSRIRNAEIYTTADLKQIDSFQSTRPAPAHLQLLPFLKQHALQRPEKVAIACADTTVTYKSLYQNSAELGGFLSGQWKPGSIIGVLTHRNLEWAQSILGIWFAGAVYLPLNPEDPIERLRYMIENAGCQTLIFGQNQVHLANALQWRVAELYHIHCIDSPNVHGLIESKTETLNQALWEYIGTNAEDKITGGGWINSYTGTPFSAREMEEYAENVYTKLKPFLKKTTKVLEIGCASGLTMFRLAPHVGEYVGTDISQVILEKNEKEIACGPFKNIRQYHLGAIETDQLPEKDFDLIIINSVVQNFAGYNYFRRVIEHCLQKAKPQATLFLGDLMDEQKRRELEQSFEDYKHETGNTHTKTDWDTEFFVNRHFLDQLAATLPGITDVSHSEKIYTLENELTKFRYDSVLRIGLPDMAPASVESPYRQTDMSWYKPDLKLSDMAPVDPLSAAYMIYTSGSTGQPKGALVSHAGMMNHLEAKKEVLDFTEQSVFAQTATHTFDISVWQLLLGIYTGGKTVIYGKDTVLDFEGYLSRLSEDRVSAFEVVPSYFNTLLFYLEQQPAINLERLEKVVSCGEIISPDLIQRWHNLFPQIAVINAYGPTEASCDITHHVIHKPVLSPRVPIGRPLPNLRVTVVNPELQPCPLYVKGEIVVSGIGVGLGYINDTEKTAKAFVEHSVAGEKETMYRTGDIGRYTEDGTIDFFGRKDSQVKIRGYRIELGELEGAVSKLMFVKQAAVVTKEESGQTSLQAFVVLTEGADSQKVREQVKKQLPDYMVPEDIICLDSLPQLPSGKVDRKKLTGLAHAEEQIVLDKTLLDPTESALVDLWQKVLGHNRFSAEDSFFEVGGHSLKAMRLISEIAGRLDVQLGFRELFTNSSIHTMAGLIGRTSSGGQDEIEPLGPREVYECSHAQRRLWLLHQFENVQNAYHEFDAYRVKGEFDTEAARSSFLSLAVRHESLRTVFVTVDGEPMQRIIEPENFQLNFQLLAQGSKSLEELVAEERSQPFDLEEGPLFRVKFISAAANEHVVLLTMHHIITDGWSAILLMKEFFKYYESHKKQLSPDLPPIKIHYKEYAAWQNQKLAGGYGSKSRAYWEEKLAGELTRLEIPTVNGRSTVQSYEGTSIFCQLNHDVCHALDDLIKAHEASPFVVFQAALNFLFFKITGQQDIITGTVVAGRDQAAVQEMIGFFVNTLPVRVTIKPDQTVAGYIRDVRSSIGETLSYSQYPFDKLLDDLKIDRDLSRSPIFDILVEFQGFNDLFDWQRTAIDSVNVEALQFESTRSLFDISFILSKQEGHYELEIEYNTQLYAKEQMHTYVDYLGHIIRNMAAQTSDSLANIAIYHEHQKNELLDISRGNKRAIDQALTIDMRIDISSEQHGQKLAVICEDRQLSYQQFSAKANQLANFLNQQGISHNQVAGLLMDRTELFSLAIDAIWKANAAYMPIDAKLPIARIRDMVNQAKVGFLIIGSEYVEMAENLCTLCPGLKGFLRIDDPNALAPFDTQASLHREPRPEDLAYVLFTSGSTGQPKGVMIEHQSMLNHKLAMIDALALDENTVIVQTASQSFDISVWQFVTALVTGGTTVIYPDHIILDIEAFSDSIIQDGITIIEVVPSYLQLLIEHWEEAESQLPALTHMIVTGEVLPPAMADRWFSLFPDIPLVNAYGPAEAGDDVSLHFMHSAPETSPVPVGRPVNNVTVYVLNSHNQLCPPGVQGEICVSGISVGRGYANQHDSAAFVKDPFDSDQRMYKTGDLGQYNQAGELLFLGRKDNQVKVRGYRIELGEIEAMLSAQQEVAMAAVIVAEQQGGSHRIKAFAAIEEKAHITDQQLLEKLRALLPDYMVPNEVQLLPELPLLNNGKIDRKALEQVNPQATQSKQFVPPETPTEIKIAQVWQQVLGVENIGLYDDFFDLGGDSLKIVKIFRKINMIYPSKLDLSDFFMAKTVAALSDRLMNKGIGVFGGHGTQSMFHLQKELSEDKHNLFMFPGFVGLGIFYLELVKKLSDQFNCHLFNYRGIATQELPFENLEDMVSHYGQLILDTLESTDPVYLFGASSGGNLIFEVAAYLKAQGRVCTLIMGDAEPTIIPESEDNLRTYVSEVRNFLNSSRQSDFFVERYEKALRAFTSIYNNEMQNTEKVLDAHIINFLCPDSSEEVRLWHKHTTGQVSYVNMEKGSHTNMLQFEENLVLIAQQINQITTHQTHYEHA